MPRAIDPEDLTRLISVVHPPRDRALILLLLRTGMWIGELLNTRVSDVDFREQKILIYQAEKTAVGRVVYYSDDAHESLIDWLRIRPSFKEYLFYGRGRARLSYEEARSLFKKYVQAAGLEHSGYTLHCLRHIPESVIMEITGHSTREMFDRYNTIDQEDTQNAVQKLQLFLASVDQNVDQAPDQQPANKKEGL